MADKNVVVSEPIANDVLEVKILCDGLGAVTELSGRTLVGTNDPNSTFHDDRFEFDVSSLPAAAQTAVTDLIAECLTRFKSEHGW